MHTPQTLLMRKTGVTIVLIEEADFQARNSIRVWEIFHKHKKLIYYEDNTYHYELLK